MAVVDELKNVLNEVVTDSDGIDAVFVYDLKNSFMLYRSTIVKAEKTMVDALLSDVAMVSFGDLRGVRGAVDSFAKAANRGKLEYTIFHLSNGILLVYFEEVSRKPFAVGFVSTMAQGVGKILHFGEKYIDDIKDKIKAAL